MRLIQKSEDLKWLDSFLLDVGCAANEEHFGLQLSGMLKRPQYVEYYEGNGQFDWHNDYGHEHPISQRKLTVSIQLSDPLEYRGSDLEIFSSEICVLPRSRGTVSVFPSIYYHRISPVINGTRRALVAWLAGNRMT